MGPCGASLKNNTRGYATVSGDRDPIHLYPLTAKALGSRRHIAPGTWSRARCVAALDRLPDRPRVEVGFKKPIFLPGKAQFGAVAGAGGWDFALVDPKSGAPHLLGHTTTL